MSILSIRFNSKTGRPAKTAYRNETELLWFYSKELHRLNLDEVRIAYSKGSEKDKRKNPKGKSCGNVWEFSRIMPNYKEWTGHPTQKPEKLAERILLASSKPGDLVLIPFAGSGTEIEACIRTGRNWLANENIFDETSCGFTVLIERRSREPTSVNATLSS